jgi:hypothetical protein
MMKTNLKPQLSPFASQTTTEYKFKAHVGKGGSVQTMPVNDKQLHEIERAEEKEYKKGVADSPVDEAIRAHVVSRYCVEFCISSLFTGLASNSR